MNGIKFLEKSLFELKINGDNRLYATKIYVNAEGYGLIVFDKAGDHKAIEKLLRHAKPLEVNRLPSESTALPSLVMGPAFFNSSTTTTTTTSQQTNTPDAGM